MDPEALKRKEIMDSWMELLDKGSPEIAAIAKTVLGGMKMPGYDLEEILEGLEYDTPAEPEEPEGPAEKFKDNPEVVCLNNLGMEEYFDEGVTYVAELLDRDFFIVYDRNGVEREVLAERFREVKEEQKYEFKKFEPGTKVKITGEPMPYTTHYR